MTGEDEGKENTERFIKGRKVEHAYAYDRGSALQRYFGIRGIPHSVLLDPSGTVVWRGHPAQLNDEMLEAALSGALTLPTWEWPEKAGEVRTALAAGNLGTALASARRMAGDGEDKLVAALQKMVDGRLSGMKQAYDSGNYLAALEMAQRAKKALDGLPAASEATALIDRIKGDPEAQRVIKGQEELERMGRQMQRLKTVPEARELITKLEELAGRYPDTIVAQGANGMAKQIRARIRPR